VDLTNGVVGIDECDPLGTAAGVVAVLFIGMVAAVISVAGGEL